MHRIDGAGHVDHLFVAEDPATLRPPTEITPEIMNAFQEELATFIEWAGIILDKANNTQLKQALVAKFAGVDVAATKAGVQGQTYTAFTTTGATGAFVLTPNPAIAAYGAGQRFRVKFHADGNGADTMSISALGAKNIKQYDNAGAKVAAVIVANQLADVEYDGADLVILDPLPPKMSKQIQSISASVSGNALTLTLSPTLLDFRASALNNGTVNTRSVAAAISLVVPSGATLGTVNNQAARLAILAIDNAGAVELAVANLYGGINLDETTLISTTAISAAATSASVIYSTTARANVPFRVVGFIDITEAAAGTWATAPATIQGQGGQALSAMSSIGFGQTIQNVTGSRAKGTTYYNTTGRPIAVLIGLYTPSTSVMTVLSVNGIDCQEHGGSGTSVRSSMFAIIPAGGNYNLREAAGSSSTVDLWVEMR